MYGLVEYGVHLNLTNDLQLFTLQLTIKIASKLLIHSQKNFNQLK